MKSGVSAEFPVSQPKTRQRVVKRRVSVSKRGHRSDAGEPLEIKFMSRFDAIVARVMNGPGPSSPEFGFRIRPQVLPSDGAVLPATKLIIPPVLPSLRKQ